MRSSSRLRAKRGATDHDGLPDVVESVYGTDPFNPDTGNKGITEHLSYSYQNPFPANAAIANGFQLKNPEWNFAIAADMNPGGAAETKVTLQSPANDMTAANSLNHNQSGQNILYGDGHVEWQTTPFSGTHFDNIYTAFGPEIKDPGRTGAVILSSSYDNMDSVLLPTSADLKAK